MPFFLTRASRSARCSAVNASTLPDSLSTFIYLDLLPFSFSGLFGKRRLDLFGSKVFNFREELFHLQYFFVVGAPFGAYGSNNGRQARYRRMFEQRAHWQVDVKFLPQTRNHLNSDQRIPPDTEEVIIDSDLFDSEYVAPYERNCLFGLAGGRDVGRR